jgi:hypothetical protein
MQNLEKNQCDLEVAHRGQSLVTPRKDKNSLVGGKNWE